jgi:hypothetical protein
LVRNRSSRGRETSGGCGGSGRAADVVRTVWSETVFQASGAQPKRGVFTLCSFVEEKQDVARVVETVDEAVCWNGGVSATSDVFGRFWTLDSHSLVEDKTFALPMGCTDFLVVVHDAAVELVDLSKALASK